MEHDALKNVNNCLNTNIYSYLETSGGQSSNLYLNVVHFLTTVLIRYLWQLRTVVFLHGCLICGAPIRRGPTNVSLGLNFYSTGPGKQDCMKMQKNCEILNIITFPDFYEVIKLFFFVTGISEN